MVKSSEHRVFAERRIDTRYYLIESKGRYFVIDYSNPKDFRNYLLPFFPKVQSKWTIYDVTGSQDLFPISKFWVYMDWLFKVTVVFFVIFILNSILFPRNLTFLHLTYDTRISENWQMWLVLLIIGFFFLIALLNLLTRRDINLGSYPQFTLEEVKKIKEKPRSIIIIRSLIMLSITYLLLFFIGVFGNNYTQLFLFGIFFPYSIIFNKFIEFKPILSQEKFYIKEK